VTSRRRRRDRHPRVPGPRNVQGHDLRESATKAEARRRAAFEARMARIRRTRSFVGLIGFAPLLASLFCFGILCEVPREVYLAIWAAIFGTFLGLTVRMWRERRAFARTGAIP
jgi:hypothetical protein